ncbi:hypothetical protein ANCCAN_11537 [Ancylostoma caninum]|uniref:Uncharacterized protein n=1 Tax=Ancylostoma caninum TaxID=29170 RepID=A0A368GDR4_ANCCA|nr:hypothetical protein ANCCAN_11537 [Ancylostoma caninum]
MQISHSMDGLIMAVFNRRTRAHIFYPRKLLQLRLEGSHISSHARISNLSNAKSDNHDSKA